MLPLPCAMGEGEWPLWEAPAHATPLHLSCVSRAHVSPCVLWCIACVATLWCALVQTWISIAGRDRLLCNACRSLVLQLQVRP